jgi:hypothetical protein
MSGVSLQTASANPGGPVGGGGCARRLRPRGGARAQASGREAARKERVAEERGSQNRECHEFCQSLELTPGRFFKHLWILIRLLGCLYFAPDRHCKSLLGSRTSLKPETLS